VSNLLARLRDRSAVKRYSVDDYMNDLLFNGWGYSTYASSPSQDREKVENNFRSYVENVYKTNGVVFAVIAARMLVFTEARFLWQKMRDGRPGELWWNPALTLLDEPWPAGTTGELLARMEQDVSLAGNFFAARVDNRLRRLRPDWVQIVLSAPADQSIESDRIGYIYTPGGGDANEHSRVFLPDEVVHWAPVPDPTAQYRGMSWLNPVVTEVMGDRAATEHKLKFFSNGATPRFAVTLSDKVNPEQFKKFKEHMRDQHEGPDNAYKMMFLGGGADAKVVGADLKQLDFKVTQGAGETRITAAGRVPSIIVGLSEGLEAATYSNFGQARRAFGDIWARPTWRSAAAALATVLPKPSDRSRLWYDDRDIPFLREDAKDQAEILNKQMLTIEAGVRAGFKPETIRDAVLSGDLSLLEHTGLFSVQLQPAGTKQLDPATNPTPTEGGTDADQ
jgi:phage portal protein BeeE